MSIALMVYPLIVGLYAAGFFWDVPSDIAGSFDLTEFIFKASIVYLGGFVAVVTPFLLMTIIYAPILGDEQKSESSEQSVSQADEEYDVSWKGLSTTRKLVVAFASAGILIAAGFVIWLDPPPLNMTPDGFLTVLMVIFFAGMAIRPFISKNIWIGSRNITVFSFVFLLPVLIGYNDATVKPGSPTIDVSGMRCPVIFAGTESLIVRCPDSYSVVDRSVAPVLVWSIKDENP